MNIKKATLWAMVGISYIFLSRTFATFTPQFFSNLPVAKANTLLSFLSSLSVLLFYFYFYKEYLPKDKVSQPRELLMLRNATVLAFIGSLAVTFLFLKGFLHLSNILDQPSNQGYFEIIAPWISSVLGLFFYFAFYRGTSGQVSTRLTKAAMIAIIGGVMAIMVRSYLLMEFVIHGKFAWLWNLTQGNLYIFMALFLFMFLAGFYFLWCLYKELPE